MGARDVAICDALLAFRDSKSLTPLSHALNLKKL
jgi:hypothetical protein